MSTVYGEANWNEEWHNLMVGKSVFSIVANKLKDGPKIKKGSRMKREVREKTVETPDSEFNLLVGKITSLFGISSEVVSLGDEEDE
ncbi:hypothetical protein D3C76_763680 [compost metagenome]